MNYIIYHDKHNIAKYIIMKLVALSHIKKSHINIVLSGGNTPKYIFQYILHNHEKYDIEWSKLHFWWSDERYVSVSDSNNNYGQAKSLLFNNININCHNLHPISIEKSPYETAKCYKKLINNLVPRVNNFPCFDWIWLGMGDDGHTSSLFTNHDIQENINTLVQVTQNPKTQDVRITLNINVINNTKEIDILIVGEDKSLTIKNIINNEFFLTQYPIQYIKKTNNVIWHIDKKAAKYI